MSLSAKLVLAGLAVPFLLLCACDHQPKAFPPPGESKCKPIQAPPGPGNGYGRKDRQFNVYVYSHTDTNHRTECYADTDKAELWTSRDEVNPPAKVDQTVCWYSDDGNPYIVNFKRGTRKASPFQDPQGWFQVPAKGSVWSGPLLSTSSGYYDFVIVPGTNPEGPICATSDPGYRVSP